MFSRVSRKRITIWCALWGYALVASGLPLPFGVVQPIGDGAARDAAGKRLAAKDRSRPFPCMDKPCGCATAEQCFTSCCCHTPAETLAWARSHAVEPGVLAALARRAGVVVAVTPPPGCCSVAADPEPSCCAAKDTEPSCCAAVAAPPQRAAKPAARALRTVTLRALLACGGIVAQWSAVAAAPPPARLTAPPMLALSIEPLAISDESLRTRRPAPESPPPRAV